MTEVVLVTGGSSGIGYALAARLAAEGCVVYALSRRENAPAGVRHLGADITDQAAVTAAIAQIAQEQGRLDILINNAGSGVSGAVEFIETTAAEHLLQVDFFGCVHTVRAALPLMRQQGGGRILNISSVAAPIAIPFQAYYSAAKAALHAFSLALASEIRPFGIRVCSVLPGDIASGFTAAREKQHAGDEIYQGRISRSVAVMEHDEQHGMTVETAAARLCRLARRRRLPLVYVLGGKYKFFVLLSRLLPSGLLNRLVALIYAK